MGHLRIRTCLLALGLASALAGPALGEWYEERGAPPPRGDRIYYCHGYGCRIVTPVRLGAAELAQLAAPFRDVRDPAGERQAVSQAVQLYERIAGARAGTSADRAEMQFGQGKDDQLDCIDEATNTTSLMRVLSGQGALRHHEVLEPVARGFFLDGRYPHATAVLAERESGARWAVDSWPEANGGAPLIQPLRDWFRARSSPS
jgi:hypothetical protein